MPSISRYEVKANGHQRTHLLKLFTVLLPAAGNMASAGERGLEGIVNFGKVNDSLHRGAQPDTLGIGNLKKLGIKTIINLRMTNDVWKAGETEANANGITYTNMPMNGFAPANTRAGCAGAGDD